jgi:NADH dehydrogenase
LACSLLEHGHSAVLVARGKDKRDPAMHSMPHARFFAADLSDTKELVRAFIGCDAVAHCAGINRQIGEQTYQRVHIEGTRNVAEAAQLAGVRKIVLLSFLRARPNCGSAYHESKWVAEEIIRASALDYTILKAGVIYGRGDHMLDHLSRALHTFPTFGLVGFRPRPMRPLAVEDLVSVIAASMTAASVLRGTFSIVGPEELTLQEAVEKVAAAVGKRPVFIRMPILFHRGLAWIAEQTMKIPLTSLAQVRILSEGLVEALPPCDMLPADLMPATRFTLQQIQKHLPEKGPFRWRDLRCSRT